MSGFSVRSSDFYVKSFFQYPILLPQYVRIQTPTQHTAQQSTYTYVVATELLNYANEQKEKQERWH